MRIIWSLLLLPLLLSFGGVSEAQAANYSWNCSTTGFSASGSSPYAACQTMFAKMPGPGYLESCTMNSVTSYSCVGKYLYNNSNWMAKGGTSGRSGTTCAAGSVYNSATGLCDLPACPLGQDRDFYGVCKPKACEQSANDAHNPIIWSNDQDKCVPYYNLQNQEGCDYWNGKPSHQEYEYISNDASGATQHTDPIKKCGMDMTSTKCTTTAAGFHKCLGRGVYNGDFFPTAEDTPGTCPEGRTDCAAPPAQDEPEEPQPQNSVDKKPCVYTSVGGVLQCQSSQTTNNEGTKNCGTVNGVWGCTAKAPTSNGIITDTKVTTDSNADGSTKTTKTDTTTQTKCTDIGVCTSKTTVVTTVTNQDANGNTTGTNSTCKGENCANENTNPDADGDGVGDCVGDDCGEGGDSEVEGEDCSVELACTGDAIDCAILRKQKEMVCAFDWETQKDAVMTEAGKDEYKLKTEEVDSADFFPGSSGRWLGASCPPDRVIHLSLTNSTVTLSWDFVCQYASALGNLLVALASLFFAVYVGRAFGGE